MLNRLSSWRVSELAFILTRCKPVSHEEVSLLQNDLEHYQCLAPALSAESYRRKHIAVSILCLIAFWFWYDWCLLCDGALSGVDQAKWWAKHEVFYFFDHEELTPNCCVCSTVEIMDICTYAGPCSLHWSSPAAGVQSVQCWDEPIRRSSLSLRAKRTTWWSPPLVTV